MKDIPDIKMKFKLQNNLVIKLIKQDYQSRRYFCRVHNISYTDLTNVINFSKSIRKQNGEYRKICLDIAKALKVLPDMIFPDKFNLIDKPRVEFEVYLNDLPIDKGSVLSLPSPEECLIVREKKEQINHLITLLDGRRAEVIRMRYGFEGLPMTCKAIGERIGLTKERVRQLETTALKKLYQLGKGNKLREY